MEKQNDNVKSTTSIKTESPQPASSNDPSYLGQKLQQVQKRWKWATLRRMKTYLRSTIKEELLSGLALMANEQESTSKLIQDERMNALVEKFTTFKERKLQLI